MPIFVPNLAELRVVNPKLHEAIVALQNAIPLPIQDPPPPVTAIQVNSDGAGHFNAAISDSGNVKYGVNYFLELDTNPTFTAPIVHDLGTGRAWQGTYPGKTLYFRAYSQHSYPPSKPNAPLVFGGSTPTAVVGGGSGTTLIPSTGSGTAPTNGQGGGSGFGKSPVRQTIEAT